MADISKISPDNGTTIYNLKDIEARKRVPEVLLKDTVGWTGKNLLPKGTPGSRNGITYSVDSNGIVIANGTASATSFWAVKMHILAGQYIMSGCPSGGGTDTYRIDIRDDEGGSTTSIGEIIDSGSGKSFTVPSDMDIYVNIRIASGYIASNLTFSPMIRKADISDSTYEPYHESVEEVVGDIRAGQAVLGAKNQIYYPYYSSYTTDWIDDGDGKVKLNGTISSRITFVLIHRSQPHNVPSGKYILSKGFVSSDVGYSCGAVIEAYNNDTWVKNLASSDGTDEITFDIDYNGYNKINVYLFATAGTYSNLVFKPMLRLASDPDDTYVPYAMTNRELTEKKINLSDLKTVVSASSDFANFQTRIASL